jgi:hypothetical protein
MRLGTQGQMLLHFNFYVKGKLLVFLASLVKSSTASRILTKRVCITKNHGTVLRGIYYTWNPSRIFRDIRLGNPQKRSPCVVSLV